VVSDPTAKVREPDHVTRSKKPKKGQSAKAFNPLSREEIQLFKAVMDGEHSIRGFVNRDIRGKLAMTSHFTGYDKTRNVRAPRSRGFSTGFTFMD